MFTANTAFQKAGVKGLSILFASGDQGVCGREGCGFFKKKFHPDFPAASPYITAVGGTNFATANVIDEEEAWAEGGGGFSDTFGIPSYQAADVQGYLSSPDADLPPSSMGNNRGTTRAVATPTSPRSAARRTRTASSPWAASLASPAPRRPAPSPPASSPSSTASVSPRASRRWAS